MFQRKTREESKEELKECYPEKNKRMLLKNVTRILS
jgi:hypothetical protein